MYLDPTEMFMCMQLCNVFSSLVYLYTLTPLWLADSQNLLEDSRRPLIGYILPHYVLMLSGYILS